MSATTTEQRLWWCSWCKREAAAGPAIPDGWYRLVRSAGSPGAFKREGVYCGAACLLAAAALLTEKEM